jgi:ankyrin repeat protein
MGKRRNQKTYNLVRRGNRRALRQLLCKHSDLRTSNEANLVFAAIWHNRGMLRWLLEHGVSPDCRLGELGNTPLMQAAADGDLWAMQMLLKHGADANAINAESENPLGFAVAWEQAEAVRLLLAAGADVNNTEDSGPDRTQLDWAELSLWPEVIEALRSGGGKRFVELPSDAPTA